MIEWIVPSPVEERPELGTLQDRRDEAAYLRWLSRARMERVWFQEYVDHGTLSNTMQIIGDWGRAHGELLAAIYLYWLLSIWLQ